MNKLPILLFICCMVCIAFVALKGAYAFFSDTAMSTTNSFAAAAEFPSTITPSPTSTEASPTPTNTPTPTDTLTPTPTPDLTSIATHLVISEVQSAGITANDEFVEIYNPTSSSINLSTFLLKLHIINGTGTSDDNKPLTFINSNIPAHGFFLIGPNVGYTGTTSLDATYSSTSGNMIVNNGAIYISNNIAAITGLIDLIGFGSASSKEGTAHANLSVSTSTERKAYTTSTIASMFADDADNGNGYDAGNNSIDFTLRSVSQPQNSSSPAETP